MDSHSNDDDLILAGLEILESRKALSKHTFCLSCESEMKAGPLLVCAECMDDECEIFEELADND